MTRYLAFLAVFATAVAGEVQRLKLARYSTPSFQTTLQSELTQSPLSFGSDYRVPLNNYANTQYTAQISLGTPPQNFTVIFDTDVYQECKHAHQPLLYQAQENGSTISLPYGFGTTVEGIVSNDALTIGELEIISGQDFAEITTEPGLGFAFAKFDGVFGLGFQSRSENGLVPPFQNMVNQGIIESPLFSLQLGRSFDDGGELVLGGIDDNGYRGNLTYIPLRRDDRWEVALDTIQWGEEVLELDLGAGAVLDSGTTFLVFPAAVAEVLNAEIGAKKSWNGQYILPCDDVPSLPLLTFNLGGGAFPLKPTEYILEIQNECVSPFLGIDIDSAGSELWILGEIFLRKFFSVYDFEHQRIGLAESTNV